MYLNGGRGRERICRQRKGRRSHFAEGQREPPSFYYHAAHKHRGASFFSRLLLLQILYTPSYFPTNDRTHYFIISHPNSKANISTSLLRSCANADCSRLQSPLRFSLGTGLEAGFTCSLKRPLRCNPTNSGFISDGKVECGDTVFCFVFVSVKFLAPSGCSSFPLISPQISLYSGILMFSFLLGFRAVGFHGNPQPAGNTAFARLALGPCRQESFSTGRPSKGFPPELPGAPVAASRRAKRWENPLIRLRHYD